MNVFLAFVVVAFGATCVSGTPGDIGTAAAAQALKRVCWYEQNKPYDGSGKPQCDVNAPEKELPGSIAYAQSQPYFYDEVLIQDYQSKIQVLFMPNYPQSYQDACNSYVATPTQEFGKDKSGILKDDGTYPYQGFAHCMYNQLYLNYGDKAVRAVKTGKPPKKAYKGTPMHLGMEKSSWAYEAACYYELNKPFDINDDTTCAPKKMYADIDSAVAYGNTLPPNYDVDSSVLGTFKNYAHDSLKALPTSYNSHCSSYLDNPNQKFSVNESSIMMDSDDGFYPLQGLAYCLINQLKQKHGEKALNAIKPGQSRPEKNFADSLLEADNARRALHGVAPFKLDQELVARAQNWANTLASQCFFEHAAVINPNDPSLQYMGSGVGENLYKDGTGPGSSISETGEAHSASYSWYSEISKYPFPQSLDDVCGNVWDSWKQCFSDMGVGHFTQTVWKGSNLAGYAMAIGIPGSNCAGNVFVVGRYSPGGNMMGSFAANVSPAQN